MHQGKCETTKDMAKDPEGQDENGSEVLISQCPLITLHTESVNNAVSDLSVRVPHK